MLILERRPLVVGLMALPMAKLNPAPAQTTDAFSPERRLLERGISLPAVNAPAANYVPFKQVGKLVFLAGTGPRRTDGSIATGKVGRDVSLDDARDHARLTGLQLLAVMRQATGSLDKVAQVIRVEGRVNATPDFKDHPKVIDGCSDLFVEVFGDRGRHARSAYGVSSTPFDISVYIEVIVEVV